MSTDTHPDTHLLHTGGSFFEGPRWHAGRWWVSDMYGDTVLGLSPSGTVDVELPLPDHPSGLGWTPDGDLLVVLMQERTVVRVDGARRLSAHARLAGYGRGPANDMIVDASGRAWVGFLGFDMNAGEKPETTDLVCIQPDGGTSRAANGLLTPNGLALIGHGRELLIAETFASRICSFRVDADGVLHQRRAWAQLAPPPPVYDLRSCLRALRVAPDGLAIDAWDHVWFADAAGGGCVRAFGGAVLERVPPPPGLQIFACAVGGAAGNTLLMCCAPDAIEGRRRAAAQSVLITAQISAPGEGTLN